MAGVDEEIQAVQDEILRTPYNKATQLHIGKLKAKLAKLREKQEKAGKGKGGSGFSVKKEGDRTIILVGFPSAGKSTLLNSITNAKSEVAAYDFTTLTSIPGILKYNGAELQVIDIPGIIEGASKGKGMGREILSQARVADLILIMLDSTKWEKQEPAILSELHEIGVRLNKKSPDIKVIKKDRGGIEIARSVKKGISDEMVKALLSEFGYHNAYVLLREAVTEDEFIDALSKSVVYIPGITVLNKVDTVDPDYPGECVKISAREKQNLDELKNKMWEKLGLLRIYLKKQGIDADLEDPLIMQKGDTIEEVCKKVIKSYKDRFRFARVWGKGVKFGGQRVGLDFKLADENIVSVITTR